MDEKHLCHSCGNEAESQCQSCEQPVCSNCTVPFTQMNQIDYDLCNDCNDDYQEARSEELYEDSLTVNELAKYRKSKALMSSLMKAIKKILGN